MLKNNRRKHLDAHYIRFIIVLLFHQVKQFLVNVGGNFHHLNSTRDHKHVQIKTNFRLIQVPL